MQTIRLVLALKKKSNNSDYVFICHLKKDIINDLCPSILSLKKKRTQANKHLTDLCECICFLF